MSLEVVATIVLGSLAALAAAIVVALVSLRVLFALRRRLSGDGRKTIAFFHPYCNAGGGGERVLWCAIRALQTECPDARYVVYSGDAGVTGADILSKAKKHFGISLPAPVEFVFLTKRSYVEDKRYPRLTLIGQSLGSMVLGWEAIWSLVPDIFVDSMGYAFTFPIFSILGGSTVVAYVHYPTISTDMLSKVKERTADFNNDASIASSPITSTLKLRYYQLFSFLYGVVGSFADCVMVNSNWTRNHIQTIWKTDPQRLSVVYPPCDVVTPSKFDLGARQPWIVSVAQFRPEKNHRLQVESFHHLLNKCDLGSRDSAWSSTVKLILIGSCRNGDDEKRIQDLKELVQSLNITNRVEFVINASFDELNSYLAKASIGLHTMYNEHFGIGVVEYMAAGAIALAHNSGGPRIDIVVPLQGQSTGFLAATCEEYAHQMQHILNLSAEQRQRIQTAARRHASETFSEAEFDKGILAAVSHLLPVDAKKSK